jgi:Asp-tRNA(Asn)/Glu-tRNA(Gln) amidotransferase A subunit family amidase
MKHVADERARTAISPQVDPTQLDACSLSDAIRGRHISCVEVMTAYVERIEKLNPYVNAIVSLRDKSLLLEEAREKDRDLAAGRYHGWMHGMPHAVKDLSDAAGFPTTKGSPLLRDHMPAHDALFVRRIRAAGAIIIGKTNTPEFGLGSPTYNSVFGVTRNPYDLTRSAGGSSGGAAAALALRMLPVADGTDFMGSLRNPAAFNNVIGFRPSFGRVPDPSYVATPAVAGPMARTVADAAMLLSVMAGPDPRSPLSLPTDPAAFASSLAGDFNSTRIAWVGDFDGHLATEPGLLDLCEGSFEAFNARGLTPVLGHAESSICCWGSEMIRESWLGRTIPRSSVVRPSTCMSPRRGPRSAASLRTWASCGARCVTGSRRTGPARRPLPTGR